MESLISSACSLFLILYSGLLLFVLPKALNVGSQTYSVSIIHRWTGIMTLLSPIPLMAYEAIYAIHPNVYLYLFTIITIAFNCIFGVLLVPRWTPKWDHPTIRMHVVAASMGLSWIGSSLNFRFGHIPSFEPFSRFLAILSFISMVYASNDFIRHIQQFVINMKTGTAMNFGSRFRPKKASDVGLKYERPSMWYCLVSAFCERQTPKDRAKLTKASPTPSNLSLIIIQANIVTFAMIAWLQIHYLSCGHQGMAYLQETFPKSTQMSVYGYLVAAVSNNFGGFVGTLVLRKRVNLFQSAILIVVASFLPLVNAARFVAQYHGQERMDEFLWSTLTCEMKA